MPYEAKRDENNRWIILSKIVHWDEFAPQEVRDADVI